MDVDRTEVTPPESPVPPDVVLHDFYESGSGGFRAWLAWLGGRVAAAWRLVVGRGPDSRTG